MSEIIHHLELKEAVLHHRLCWHAGVEIPYVLALAPGRVNLSQDLCTYTTLSVEQECVSRGKRNWKWFLRVYCSRWRSLGNNIDLAVSLGEVHGRRKYMLASLPAFHGQRLEVAFERMIAEGGVFSLWQDHFDAHVACGLSPWLFAEVPDAAA